MIEFEIEVFDSRNTSTPQVLNGLIPEPKSWLECESIAKQMSRTRTWPVVARKGEQSFTSFERGLAIEWSADLDPVTGVG